MSYLQKQDLFQKHIWTCYTPSGQYSLTAMIPYCAFEASTDPGVFRVWDAVEKSSINWIEAEDNNQ